MGNRIVTFLGGGLERGRNHGKPIHKKNKSDGIKSQHKGLMTRHKKRKLRKKKSR